MAPSRSPTITAQMVTGLTSNLSPAPFGVAVGFGLSVMSLVADANAVEVDVPTEDFVEE